MRLGLPRTAIRRVLEVTPLPPATNASSGTTKTATTKNNRKRSKSSLSTSLQWPNVTLDAISECSVEFIKLVTTEANELAKSKKTNTNDKSVTITPEHMYLALKTLGFSAYVKEAQVACSEMDDVMAKKKKQKLRRGSNKKITKAEAAKIAQQQALLFAAAAEAFGDSDTNN